jgi:hypothetical protein
MVYGMNGFIISVCYIYIYIYIYKLNYHVEVGKKVKEHALDFYITKEHWL